MPRRTGQAPGCTPAASSCVWTRSMCARTRSRSSSRVARGAAPPTRYAGGGSATVATSTAADSRRARSAPTRAAPRLPSVPSRASRILMDVSSFRIDSGPRPRGSYASRTPGDMPAGRRGAVGDGGERERGAHEPLLPAARSALSCACSRIAAACGPPESLFVKRGGRVTNDVVGPDIPELIHARDWAALREAMADRAAPEIADHLTELSKPDRVLLFRALARAQAAAVFAYLEPHWQETLLEDLTDDETRDLLAGLPPDDRTQLLEELPGQVTQQLLNLLTPGDLEEARWLLGYPAESVGRLMTPDYVALRPEWTVEQALAHIRAKGKDSE